MSQIEEQQTTNPGGANSSSTGQTGTTGTSSTQQPSVRMVRLQTPPEAASLEVFDLTTPREQGGEAACPWRVGMVRAADEEVDEFYGIEEDGHNDCYEPSVEVPGHVAIVAMGLWDDEMEVNMVKTEQG